MVTDRTDDRAQLMLVGAIVVALLVFGVVIVVNSVLYTNTIAPQAASDATADAAKYTAVAERDLQTLANELAADREFVPRALLKQHSGDYSRQLSRVVAEERNYHLEISYNESASAAGSALIQNSTRRFTAADGSEDWTLSRNASGVERVSLELHELSKFPTSKANKGLFVVVTNGSSTWEFRAYRGKHTDELTFQTRNDSSAWNDLCRAPGPISSLPSAHVEVEVVDGRLRVDNVGCGSTTPFGGDVAPSYELLFENNTPPGQDEPTGTYELWVDGDIEEPNFDNATTYAVPAVFSASFDLEYDGPNLRFDRTITGIRPNGSAAVGGGVCSFSGFSSEFEQSSLADTRWTAIGDIDAGIDDVGGERMAYLDADDDVDERDGYVRLAEAVDTSYCDGLSVNYRATAGEKNNVPETDDEDEGLVVEYFAANGTWVEADRIGNWTEEQSYDRSVRINDARALHEEFRLRIFQPQSDNPNDHWFLDDIGLVEDSGGGDASVETYLESDFEASSLGDTDWVGNGTGDVVLTGQYAAESGETSVALKGGTDTAVEYGKDLDTAGASTLTVQYWARAGGDGDSPEVGSDEYLVVEARAANGTWVEVDRIDDWDAGDVFTETVSVSDTGLAHGEFSVRFRRPGSTYDDTWLVDDVIVEEERT
jgi:hypothetical protein